MNETKEQQEHVERFFENYPDESIYDNNDELRPKLEAMRDAVVALRKEAIAKRSIALLDTARVLDLELGLIVQVFNQKRVNKAMSSGIALVGHDPDVANTHWRK